MVRTRTMSREPSAAAGPSSGVIDLTMDDSDGDQPPPVRAKAGRRNAKRGENLISKLNLLAEEGEADMVTPRLARQDRGKGKGKAKAGDGTEFFSDPEPVDLTTPSPPKKQVAGRNEYADLWETTPPPLPPPPPPTQDEPEEQDVTPPLRIPEAPLFLPDADEDAGYFTPPLEPPVRMPSPPPAAGPARQPSLPPAAGPARQLTPPRDPLASILEIVPDVEPDHATSLLTQFTTTQEVVDLDAAVQLVLHHLFENPTYPKVEKTRKRKRDGNAEDGERKGKEREVPAAKFPRIDYASVNRPAGSTNYKRLALKILQQRFPGMTKTFIDTVMKRHNRLYAPTYLYLVAEEAKPPHERGYKEKNSWREEAEMDPMAIVDEALREEVQWVELFMTGELRLDANDGKGKQRAEPAEDEPESVDCEEDDGGIECGCCFGSYRFDTMVQCPDAHLFCMACVRNYVVTKLGEGVATLLCMSSSDPRCEMSFTEGEISKAVKDKTMDLYHRVCTRRDLQAAGLVNLEECPFCEFACVVDNPDEKLFRCQRDDCGEVSCRGCKKKDHLPKSCEEAAKDCTLDAQHAVEEAMTNALMRTCPKCSQAFIKESGCNKMSCTKCGTLSCYVCRQIVVGYDHFNQQPGRPQTGQSTSSKKCPLWDQGQNVENTHQAEVAAAREQALREVAAQNPEVNAADIKVDLPAQARPAVPGLPRMPIPPMPAVFNAELDRIGGLAGQLANYVHAWARQVPDQAPPQPAPVPGRNQIFEPPYQPGMMVQLPGVAHVVGNAAQPAVVYNIHQPPHFHHAPGYHQPPPVPAPAPVVHPPAVPKRRRRWR